FLLWHALWAERDGRRWENGSRRRVLGRGLCIGVRASPRLRSAIAAPPGSAPLGRRRSDARGVHRPVARLGTVRSRATAAALAVGHRLTGGPEPPAPALARDPRRLDRAGRRE